MHVEHDLACGRYQVDTCRWFLDSETYTEWRSGKAQFVWIRGKSGCCKTVLTSAIIEDLRDRYPTASNALAFFYVTFSDPQKQSYRAMLQALVSQSVETAPVPENVQQAYQDSRGRSPTTKQLEMFFDGICQLATVHSPNT